VYIGFVRRKDAFQKLSGVLFPKDIISAENQRICFKIYKKLSSKDDFFASEDKKLPSEYDFFTSEDKRFTESADEFTGKAYLLTSEAKLWSLPVKRFTGSGKELPAGRTFYPQR
jgi:hypothetical protein